MKYTFLKIIVLLLPFGLYAQHENDAIISTQFKQVDSLFISLKYKEGDGCLGYFVGRMKMKIKGGYFGMIHFTTSEILKSDHFKGKDEQVLNYFIELETKAKKERTSCNNLRGDHCYEIELIINGVKTEFMYVLNKERQWNGLAVLFEKLKQLKVVEDNKSNKQ